METLRPPKPKIEFYDVTCSNKQCNALMRCRKSDLDYHENYDVRDPREQPYWTMTCPHCRRATYVNLDACAVKQ